MYNEMRKQQYVEEKRTYATLSNNIIATFYAVEQREMSLGRDLCEWSSNEIIDYYKWLSTPNIQTLVQLNSAIAEYTNWCISNGLVSDNQNHYTEITTQMLCECIDLNRFKRFILTREKIIEDIKDIPNAQDKFIILGLFEGITLKNQNLPNVKISDFEGNIVHLAKGTDLQVSYELVQIAKSAAEELEYITLSSKNVSRSTPYEPGHETILKPLMSKRGIIRNPSIIIGTRLRRIVSYLGWEEGITIKTVSESGRLEFIRTYAKRHNIKPEDFAVMAKYKPIHEQYYGTIQNGITYMKTYGAFL